MSSVLVTGGAGFIGMHTAIALRRSGARVVALDNMNSYYSQELKMQRVKLLEAAGAEFVFGDVCNATLLRHLIVTRNVVSIVHLAAQAGIRYSIAHPHKFIHNNIDCFVSLMETLESLNFTNSGNRLVFASSSSVYGDTNKVPFSELEPLGRPQSIYAMSKVANENTARVYYHLYGLRSVALRFFTVYGPWGRPDMAIFSFAQNIAEGIPIKLYTSTTIEASGTLNALDFTDTSAISRILMTLSPASWRAFSYLKRYSRSRISR